MAQAVRNNQTGLIIAACIISAGLIFGGWIQFQPNISQAKEGIHNLAGQNQDIRYAFRNVAKEVLPAVVSINTRTEPKVVKNDPENNNEGPKLFFQGDPLLKEFFNNDPRLKEFFNGQNLRQTPRRPRRGQGSGFIIDSTGIIVTNNHVVAGADSVYVRLHDGREFKATSVKTDERTDLAVVTIDAGEPLKALPLGNSDMMEIGDWVVAVGNPFGLELTVTSGIISAKGRGPGINDREDFLQTDAAVNPGNSGGPLVNLNGEVIGINSAITTRNGGNDGVAFAIPINMAKWVVNQLLEKGEVQRAYIGVVIQPVTNDLAKHLNTKVGEGALVNQVSDGAPADLAGVQSGDVILKLNNEKVNSTRQLQAIVEKLKVDQTYSLEIIRNGKPMNLNITMKAMPKDYSLTSRTFQRKQNNEPSKSKHSNKLGVEVTELTEEMAKQLDAKVGQGVVVKSVDEGSLAGNAGVEKGDIIERIGKTDCKSVEDFENALKDASLEEGVMLLIRSDGRSRFLVIKQR